MKRAFAFFPVAVAAAILELASSSVFGNYGSFGTARPDLVLIVLCVAAFNLPVKPAVLCGLTAGMTLDVFSGGAFGTCAAAYAAAAFIASRVRQSVAHDTVFSQVVTVFLLAGFVEMVCVARLGILSCSFDVFSAAKTSALTAVLSALAAPVVFQLRPVFERIGVLSPTSSIIRNGAIA